MKRPLRPRRNPPRYRHRPPPLRDVQQQRQNPRQFPRRARDIRRADVPAPVLPHVLSRENFDDEKTERNRADEIRARNERDREGGGHAWAIVDSTRRRKRFGSIAE